MNDDFLYRLRAEPPPHFAATLKARLDRMPSRRTVVARRVGLGALLFGTALAMGLPGVRQSIFSLFGQPASIEVISPQLQSLVKEPSEDVDIDIDVKGLNDGIASELEPVQELPDATNSGTRNRPSARTRIEPPPANPAMTAPTAEPLGSDSVASNVDQSGVEDGALSGLDISPHAEQNEFIVTGPLMYEAGTPSGAVLVRTSLFKLIAWSMKPVSDMLRDRRAFDAKAAALSARRLEQLAPMITDAFALDTRGSNVESRSRDDIWARPADFRLMTNQLTRAAGELNAAVQSGERIAMLRAAARIGMSCTVCHDAFVKGGASNLPPP